MQRPRGEFFVRIFVDWEEDALLALQQQSRDSSTFLMDSAPTPSLLDKSRLCPIRIIISSGAMSVAQSVIRATFIQAKRVNEAEAGPNGRVWKSLLDERSFLGRSEMMIYSAAVILASLAQM